MNKLLSILAVILFGCSPASPPTVYIEKKVPVPVEQQPQPEPEVYTCAQALEYPGVYAARLEGEELENYLAIVDLVCSFNYSPSCEVGLIDMDRLMDLVEFCDLWDPQECLAQFGDDVRAAKELYLACVGSEV